jgi:hypothetical protein
MNTQKSGGVVIDISAELSYSKYSRKKIYIYIYIYSFSRSPLDETNKVTTTYWIPKKETKSVIAISH